MLMELIFWVVIGCYKFVVKHKRETTTHSEVWRASITNLGSLMDAPYLTSLFIVVSLAGTTHGVLSLLVSHYSDTQRLSHVCLSQPN